MARRLRLEVSITKIKVYSVPKEMLRTGLWPTSYIKWFELRYFVKEMDFGFITDVASITHDHLPRSVQSPRRGGTRTSAWPQAFAVCAG